MKHLHIPRPDGPIIAAFLVLLICIRLAFTAYETVYKNTPDYSFLCVTQAINANDSSQVAALIDDKELAGQVFDAVVSKGSGIESSSILRFAWAPMREDFIANCHYLVETRFQANADQEKKDEIQGLVTRQLKTLGCAIPIDGWHIVNTHWAFKTDDDHAELPIDVYNETLDATIPCTLTMTRSAQGRWAITGIANANDFIQAVQSAWAKKLEKYNIPVQQKINAIITIENPSARLVRTDDGRTFLRITYTPVFAGNSEDIKEIHGLYKLCKKGDGTVLYEGDLIITKIDSHTPHTSQFLLNPMLPSQDAIASRQDLDDTYSTITIWSILKEDGTALTIADRLPDE